jgi:hypothetical protein
MQCVTPSTDEGRHIAGNVYGSSVLTMTRFPLNGIMHL